MAELLLIWRKDNILVDKLLSRLPLPFPMHIISCWPPHSNICIWVTPPPCILKGWPLEESVKIFHLLLWGWLCDNSQRSTCCVLYCMFAWKNDCIMQFMVCGFWNEIALVVYIRAIISCGFWPLTFGKYLVKILLMQVSDCIAYH